MEILSPILAFPPQDVLPLVMGVRHKSVYVAVCGFPLSSQSAKRVAALGSAPVMAPESTIPCTHTNPTLAPCTHIYQAFSSHTYHVLHCDLDCEQLCRQEAGSRVEGAVPTVMARLAFMELQSAFGSAAPPNLNMDTTFTQRQRETCKPVPAFLPTEL